MVAVGKRVSPLPPHRSRRALLTHRAPPSGSGVEAVARQGVEYPDRREETVDKAGEPLANAPESGWRSMVIERVVEGLSGVVEEALSGRRRREFLRTRREGQRQIMVADMTVSRPRTRNISNIFRSQGCHRYAGRSITKNLSPGSWASGRGWGQPQ